MARSNISQEYLKSCISYDPETGVMRWLVSNSIRVKVGDEIRGKTVRGYKRCQIDKIRYKAHDLAWLYMTGAWPEALVDHRDCDPQNLRWQNLRPATQMQNCHNKSLSRHNTSGIKGVHFRKREQKWFASVRVAGKTVQRSFPDIASAQAAVREMCIQLHGELANHG